MSKTEVQALNGASRQKFTSPTRPVFDTHNPATNSPREFYKYLGVSNFTNSHPQKLLALAKREVASFFTRLQPILLISPELVSLVNCQLIPVLCYRLIAHRLTLNQLHSLCHFLWTSLTKQRSISTKISPKDRYRPKGRGGLNLTDLESAIHKFNVSSALPPLRRYASCLFNSQTELDFGHLLGFM